jgi:hypothetical protein
MNKNHRENMMNNMNNMIKIKIIKWMTKNKEKYIIDKK